MLILDEVIVSYNWRKNQPIIIVYQISKKMNFNGQKKFHPYLKNIYICLLYYLIMRIILFSNSFLVSKFYL